jgi:hypothetical protein
MFKYFGFVMLMNISSGASRVPEGQMCLMNFYQSDKVSLTMTSQIFVDNLVSMVDDDGTPQLLVWVEASIFLVLQ